MLELHTNLNTFKVGSINFKCDLDSDFMKFRLHFQGAPLDGHENFITEFITCAVN